MTVRTATKARRPIGTEPAEPPRRTSGPIASKLSWPGLSLRRSSSIDLRGTEMAGEPVHPRIALRREQVVREARRDTNWLRWGSLATAVACTIVVAGLFSPLADLDHLEVQGLEGEPAVTVREVSGLVTGTAMFGVRPGEVRRRVESLPWVAHADVDARWPDTVTVSVTPHRPLAMIEPQEGSPEGRPAGSGSVLTSSGVVLDRADLGPIGPFAEGLPDVSVDPSYVGPTGSDGSPVEYSEVARNVLEQLRPVTAQAVSGLHLGAPETVTLVAQVPGGSSDVVLALGGSEDLPAKAIALESVLSGTVEPACLERVDVSVPTRVTILRSGGCTIPKPGEAAE